MLLPRTSSVEPVTDVKGALSRPDDPVASNRPWLVTGMLTTLLPRSSVAPAAFVIDPAPLIVVLLRSSGVVPVFHTGAMLAVRLARETMPPPPIAPAP